MKTTVFTFVFLLIVFVINAQVTLDKQYNYSTATVKLETQGYKYFLMDVPGGLCRIYNTDHSLFRTINCNIPSGFLLSDIKFISEKRFDSDSGIELLCTFYKYNTSLNYYEYDSKIINEDGSLVQFIDGARYNFINKTGRNEEKLFSYCYDYSVFPEKIWTNIFDVIENPVYGEEFISICSGGDYLGWTESGDYLRTIVLGNGIDSIIATHLNVIPAIETNELVSVCEGENYKGFTGPGNYSISYTAVSGCDSTLNIRLLVNPVPDPEIIIIGDTLRSKIGFDNYQWFKDETELAGASLSEYVVESSGEYSLKVVDSNSCFAISDPVYLTFSSGKSFAINDLNYSVIPNPSNGEFIFRINSTSPGKMVLKLLNSAGQLIKTEVVNDVVPDYTKEFNVSSLAKGIYYLQIELNSAVKMEKVIIN